MYRVLSVSYTHLHGLIAGREVNYILTQTTNTLGRSSNLTSAQEHLDSWNIDTPLTGKVIRVALLSCDHSTIE